MLHYPSAIFVARNKTPGYNITGAIQYQSLQGLFSILFVFLLNLFTPVINFRQSVSLKGRFHLWKQTVQDITKTCHSHVFKFDKLLTTVIRRL